MCLLRADSAYGKAAFLLPLYALVAVVRLRAGMKVWAKAPDADPTGGAAMKDKPFDVLRVQVLDTDSQRPVFDRPLFLAVSGRRKSEVFFVLLIQPPFCR